VLKVSAAAAGYVAARSLTGSLSAAEEGLRDVVVVGGGLSGLMAAYSMQDHDVLLLEKEPVAGGRICSGTWGGFHYSMGAAYTGTPDAEMREFFGELGIKPMPVPPPVDGLAYRGKIYPEDYFTAALGSRKALRDYIKMAEELMRLSEDGIEEAVYSSLDHLAEYEELDQYSMQQWLDRHKIDPTVQLYVDTENRGLFGVSNGDFSFLFDIPELAYNFYEEGLSADDFHEGPVPDFNTYRPEVDPDEVDTWTFPRGMMEMVRAMTERTPLRSKVVTGAEVTRVTVNQDKTVTVRYTHAGQGKEVRTHAAVLATPAPVTAKIVRNGFSPAVMEALRAVDYTTYVTMALFMSERLIRNAWNVACLDSCFTTLNDAIRTQVPVGYRGKAIMGVAMPPRRASDRSLINASDNEILELALKDIERYFPGARQKVLGKDVKRFHHAFPVFRPGYGEILWALNKDASTRGPLFLAGDYVIYPTMGGAAVSGEQAFERVSAYADTL
jgi:protoporphyrinogen oxidase